MKTLLSAVVLSASFLAAPATFAETAAEWPSRTVTIVIPHNPGGSASWITNMVAEKLTEQFGQKFIIDYQPGATGMIGSKVVAGEPADGYTLLFTGVPSHVIAPAVASKRPYDTMKDFTHIAYLGGANYVLVASPALGVKTLDDLKKYSDQQSQGMNYVSAGTGTHGHTMTEYIGREVGLKLNHIPYDGAGPATQDLIGGHVKLGGMTWSSAAEHVTAGNFVPIAVAADERLPVAPDVPTFKELGYPQIVAHTWFALGGPAGIPKDIVAKINDGVIKAINHPDVKPQLEQAAFAIRDMSPEDITAYFESELERWTPFANKVGEQLGNK